MPLVRIGLILACAAALAGCAPMSHSPLPTGVGDGDIGATIGGGSTAIETSGGSPMTTIPPISCPPGYTAEQLGGVWRCVG